MKKILTVAATISLAVAGFVSISSPESASALTPTSNMFALNVANQSSGSAPRNYYELGGKTYFTANTLSKAASLWRVDGDITKEPEFMFDPFNGVISGRIENLWGYDKFLFFWVQDTKNYSSMQPYVLNTETKEAKPIQDVNGNNTMLSYESPGFFSETNGVIYGFANGNWNWQAAITVFNPIDMNVSVITTTPVVPDRSGGFYAAGNYLYIKDSRLFRYDLTANTWSDPLQHNGVLFNGVRIHGQFLYNGEKGIVVSDPVNKPVGWSDGSQYESFFIKPDGTFVKFGTWKFEEPRTSFANLNGDLYVSYTYERQFAKIDPITGEKTDVYATMFPGLTTQPHLRAVREVGDKLVFSISLLGVQQGHYRLYSWDGVGPATRFTDVNPALGQSDYAYSASNSYAGANVEIGAVGNYAIVGLNRDPAIGAEPYYVALDGTVTLMKDMNRATDGSAPNTNCFISTPDGAWMTGNIPLGTETTGAQSVIVSMKPEGTFLKYSVIGIGSLLEPCGFAYIGEDVFFNARNSDYLAGIYKRSPDGTITKMTDMPMMPGTESRVNTGEKALSYGGNYYWLAGNWYNRDLYKYDVAANTVTRLTGNDGDVIGNDGAREMILSGSKLVLVGGSDRNNANNVFTADLSEANFTLTNITPEEEKLTGIWYPDSLMNFNGKVIFTSPVSDRTNDVLEVKLDTNEIVKFFNIDEDGATEGHARKMFQAGSKLYINYIRYNGVSLRKWSSGTMASSIPMDPNFRLQCAAPAGGDVIVQDNDGRAFYYGNGLNMKPINYDFSGNSSAFCYSASTSHGTYLSLPEYPYDQNAIGFGSEPGYIGPLTPIAVSRLGESVTEAPAVPVSSAVPSEVTPEAPGAPGIPIATAGAGKASLTWTAPTTGGDVSTYIVESTPAGAQCEIFGTSAECGGLAEGVAYTFTVTATNAGGIAKSSVSNSAIPGPAAPAPGTPGKPTGVGIEGGIDLTWTAPTTGGPVDSYIVQSNPAGGACVITGTTARCTGLNNFQSYTFTVLAMNDTDISSSETSGYISAGDPAFAPPGDYMEPPVLTPLSGAIRATVVKSTSGGTPTYYRIRLYDESEDRVGQCFIYVPDESCVFEGLDPEMSYNAVSRAYNDEGSSDSSDYSDSVYPLAPSAPGVPGVPTIEAGVGKLTVTATAPTEGGQVLSYDVTLSPGGATCTITAPATSCEITGLEPGVTYSATTVAKNDLGTSESSAASAGISVLADAPGQPDAPTLVAGAGKVTVTVVAPTSGAEVTSYLVTLSPSGKTCVVTSPATTCEITGLDPEESYTASVVARNADGESSPSEDSAEVTPLSLAPGTPGTPSLVAGPGKVTVTVVAPTTGAAVTSYLVTLSPSGKTCVVTAPATTCEVTGLDSTVAYTASVVARNAEGSSSASAVSTSVTPLIALPGAPAAPTVLIGNGKVTLTAAPSQSGGAATTLTVTATPGGAFCVITLPATSCDITGLTNKTSYTFVVAATNSSGSSISSVSSGVAIPVDPNADVAPEEGDGNSGPKGISSGGTNKFVATNDSTFQLAWDKKTGKLISRATGIYTGYIEAKITFTKAGKTHVCTAQFGVLKVMPQKTAAQKTAAMKLKTFTGKQFCIDKTKMDPKTLAPKGGMTTSNFKKLKAITKSAAELAKEKLALAALKGFAGQVDIQVVRYRAWPTTMLNVGTHTGKGGKIPALIRNTKVTLG